MRTGFLLPLLLAAAGCATIHRTPFTAADQAAATVPGIPDARFWADAPDLARRMAAPIAAEPGGPTAILELSSGGDDGAFAAGLLAGWTDSGTRPPFAIVTGVSTGALIAPFAFLGPQGDGTLAYVFTHLGAGDVFRLRFPLTILGSTSAATDKGLQRVIADEVSDRVIDAIAAEHARGRRLFVQTTNIDAKRGVVWDMGAIAASGAPGRYALFRRVLLASAALPGFLPPVTIKATTGTRTIEELHVDGGVTGQLLDAPVPGPVWLVASSRLGGDFAMTSAHTLPIARRAFGFDLQSALAIQASGIWRRAQAQGAPFRFAFIGHDLPEPNHQMFAPAYMRAAYDYGVRRGLAGAWIDHPPGPGER